MGGLKNVRPAVPIGLIINRETLSNGLFLFAGGGLIRAVFVFGL